MRNFYSKGFLSICMLLVVFVVMSSAPTYSSAVEIKKWTDNSGKTHYGERPPASTAVKGVDNNVSVVDGPVVTSIVSLYSTKSCGYCKKARAYMDANSIQYREYDIEESVSANSRFKQMGGTGVPFLVMKGKTLSGFREASYRRFFEDNS